MCLWELTSYSTTEQDTSYCNAMIGVSALKIYHLTI